MKYGEAETGYLRNAGIIEEIYFMLGDNCNGRGAAWARGFLALCAVLAMAMACSRPPAAAGPFAYVMSSFRASVIDTVSNTVVAYISLQTLYPNNVAVTRTGNTPISRLPQALR